MADDRIHEEDLVFEEDEDNDFEEDEDEDDDNDIEEDDDEDRVAARPAARGPLGSLRAGWREFREEFTETVRDAHQHIGFGNLLSLFLVGAYTGMHFPFLLLFSHAMRVLTWPWAFAVGMVTGRPPHRVQPHLRFACIVRSMAAFADSSALAPLLQDADPRERSALHLMPLLVGAEYGLTTFANVFLLRAPFRLEPSSSKRFNVVVGEGEPLTRMDRAFLLGFISVLPVAILVSAVLTETGLVS